MLTDTGCIETPTLGARKVRFKGRQMPAYRFIFCILIQVVAGYDDVVRHRLVKQILRAYNKEHEKENP